MAERLRRSCRRVLGRAREGGKEGDGGGGDAGERVQSAASWMIFASSCSSIREGVTTIFFFPAGMT